MIYNFNLFSLVFWGGGKNDSISILNKEDEIIWNFNFVSKFSRKEEEEVMVDEEEEVKPSGIGKPI